MFQLLLNPHLADPIGSLISKEIIERSVRELLHLAVSSSFGGDLGTNIPFEPEANGSVAEDE